MLLLLPFTKDPETRLGVNGLRECLVAVWSVVCRCYHRHVAL